MHLRSVAALALVAFPLLALGCSSSSGLDTQSVEGTVTFDGQPVAEGYVLFRAMEGDMRSFAGPIQEGHYELEATTGRFRVEITASRPVPGKFDESNPGEKVPVGEMYIPARYNTKSELTAEVEPGGNTVDFALTAK